MKRLIKLASLQLDSPRKTEYTNKIRNEREDVTIDAIKIQRIVRDYYEKLYTNKLDNLEDMDEFLEIYNLTGLNQDETKNLNRLINSKENESVIKNLSTNKSPGQLQ